MKYLKKINMIGGCELAQKMPSENMRSYNLLLFNYIGCSLSKDHHPAETIIENLGVSPNA